MIINYQSKVAIIAFAITSCGVSNEQYDYVKDHVLIAKQQKIPLQLEWVLGKGYHFITGYPAQNKQIWRSNFYIFGKYKLSLEIRLSHDAVKKSWTRTGPVLIQINEILDIKHLPQGQIETNYGAQWQFGEKEWDDILKNGLKQIVKMKNSEGNFEELVKDKPIKNFDDYVQGWTKDLIPVELPKIEQKENPSTTPDAEADLKK